MTHACMILKGQHSQTLWVSAVQAFPGIVNLTATRCGAPTL
jgi:hypothetical protein